jgi:predicted transcriptional regulator
MMVAKLGISKASVERAINSLKSKGIITRKGAFKNGTWNIL